VTTPDGAKLACYRREVGKDSPTVVFFHGNGEVVADYVPGFSSLLAGFGCSVLLAEYRGYGSSSGQPGLQTMLDDVAAILDAIDVPDSRLVLYGRSIGSLAAIRGIRLRPDAAALVIDSGIFDAAERVAARATPDELGTDAKTLEVAITRELDPVPALATFRGRSLILHAQHDDLVAVTHAQRLFEHAREPKRLVLFDDGDHNSIFDVNEAEYVRALKDWIGASS